MRSLIGLFLKLTIPRRGALRLKSWAMKTIRVDRGKVGETNVENVEKLVGYYVVTVNAPKQ